MLFVMWDSCDAHLCVVIYGMCVGQDPLICCYEAAGCAAVLPLTLPRQGEVWLRMHTEDLYQLKDVPINAANKVLQLHELQQINTYAGKPHLDYAFHEHFPIAPAVIHTIIQHISLLLMCTIWHCCCCTVSCSTNTVVTCVTNSTSSLTLIALFSNYLLCKIMSEKKFSSMEYAYSSCLLRSDSSMT